MSAFICNDKHIATVVKSLDPAYNDLQAIADLIKAANIKSVNFHYQEETEFEPCDLSQADEALSKNFAAIIKLAQSIDYQSCECHDWEESKAFAALHAISSNAGWNLIQETVKQDELPWSI